MRSLLASLAVVGIAATSGTAALAEPIRSPGRFGLGIGSGTLANGLSAKWYVHNQHAFQFNLGVFGGRGIDNRWHRFGGFGFSVDYLFEMPAIARAGHTFELGWNLGLGLGIGFDDDDYDHKGHHYHNDAALAASFVLGLEFNFLKVPLDIVIEYRPGFLLVPYADFDPVDFTAHIRFYF